MVPIVCRVNQLRRLRAIATPIPHIHRRWQNRINDGTAIMVRGTANRNIAGILDSDRAFLKLPTSASVEIITVAVANANVANQPIPSVRRMGEILMVVSKEAFHGTPVH